MEKNFNFTPLIKVSLNHQHLKSQSKKENASRNQCTLFRCDAIDNDINNKSWQLVPLREGVAEVKMHLLEILPVLWFIVSHFITCLLQGLRRIVAYRTKVNGD
uniref:Uncharacterized protein n=1 Tax=Glossina brevipalpis TaxID=37001 RepID=A0A1A9WD95_9MUSC